MYNRNTNSEDPWLSIKGHPNEVIYGEDSRASHLSLIQNTGAKVFIRKEKRCWNKVRHLPEVFSRWYDCTDRLKGTCKKGDPGNDLNEWSVKFD